MSAAASSSASASTANSKPVKELSSLLPVPSAVQELMQTRASKRSRSPLQAELVAAPKKRVASTTDGQPLARSMQDAAVDDRAEERTSRGRGRGGFRGRGGRGGSGRGASAGRGGRASSLRGRGSRGGRGGRGGGSIRGRGGRGGRVQPWHPEEQPEIPASVSDENRALLSLFFTGTQRGVPAEDTERLVAAAWTQNPELTLQILLHARDAREGKGERATVYAALAWLRRSKPRTYLCNLLNFLRVGTFKDLLQLAAAAKRGGQPSLGADARTPVELELMAEFLRADQHALQAFRLKQQQRLAAGKSADEEKGNDMAAAMEDVVTADGAASSSTAAAVEVPSVDEDFELLTKPAAPKQAKSSVATQFAIDAELVVDAEPLRIELCFCIDSTGSMSSWLQGAKDCVRALVEQLNAECAASGRRCIVRLALVGYVDWFDSPRYDLQNFTTDVNEFHAALAKLHARGGADEPEDLLGGLEQALKFDWSPPSDEKTVRLLLLIADAPCHGAQFSNGDSPESTAYLKAHPEDPESTIRSIRSRGIRFSFCRITPRTDVMLEMFQGWFDDRRTRRVLNVMQLGQRVAKLLPALVEEITVAALGRKPVTETPEMPEDDAEVIERHNRGEEEEEAKETSDAPMEPNAVAKPVRKAKGVPQAMLSLAGKWCPTENSHFDAPELRFAATLARLLFPPTAPAAAAGASSGALSAATSSGAQKYSAKQYRLLCSSLRSELQIVERLMCTQQWTAIDFARVPAKASLLLRQAFMRHAGLQYTAFLGRVKRGEVTIKSVGIQPHELCSTYRLARVPGQVDETIELQWQAMVRRMRESTAAEQTSASAAAAPRNVNALVMLDVSGSMTWNACSLSNPASLHGAMPNLAPIDAGISLALLASELSTGAFRDRMLTFSDDPVWISLPDSRSSTLCARVDALYGSASSGGSTDLDAALRMILSVAKESHCAPADLPRSVIVLSDMALDQATKGAPPLNIPSLRAEFAAAGFEMPQVVFWNVAAPATLAASQRGSSSSSLVPGVHMGTDGVTMLSGYSSALVQLVLKQELPVQPMTLLQAAVEPYAPLVTVDEQER